MSWGRMGGRRAIGIAVAATMAAMAVGALSWQARESQASAGLQAPSRAEQPQDGGQTMGAAKAASLAGLEAAHQLERGVAVPAAGRAFVIRRGHERWPPGDALTFVRTLLPATARGEADATYRIYLVVDACDSAMKTDVVGSYQQLRHIVPHHLQQTATRMAECEPLLLDDSIKPRGEWLSLAAEQGSIEAAVVYSLALEQVVGGPEQWLKYPEKVLRHRRRAMDYLHQAVALGSVDAMSQLSDIHSHGFYGPADPTKAVAYQSVVARVDPHLANKRILDRRTAEATSDQKRDAKLLEEEIYQQCCLVQHK